MAKAKRRRLWVLMAYLDGDNIPVGVFSNKKVLLRLAGQVNKVRVDYGGEEALSDYSAYVEELENTDPNPPLEIHKFDEGGFAIRRRRGK